MLLDCEISGEEGGWRILDAQGMSLPLVFQSPFWARLQSNAFMGVKCFQQGLVQSKRSVSLGHRHYACFQEEL